MDFGKQRLVGRIPIISLLGFWCESSLALIYLSKTDEQIHDQESTSRSHCSNRDCGAVCYQQQDDHGVPLHVSLLSSSIPYKADGAGSPIQRSRRSCSWVSFPITKNSQDISSRLAVLNFRFELQRDSPTTHVLSSSAGLINVETFNDTASKLPVS